MDRRAGRLTHRGGPPPPGRPSLTPGIDAPPATVETDATVETVETDAAPLPPAGDLPIPGFGAENELERRLALDPILVEGLRWGTPRRGHPEGSIGIHVGDLLRIIDERGESGRRRSELRFLALVHDSLKGRVKEWLPRTGENHHAMRARRLAERYSADERLLATIELHDRPYSLWKRVRRTGNDQGELIDAMLARLPDPGLFMRFVEVDGSTEGKDPGPVRWFRDELAARSSQG